MSHPLNSLLPEQLKTTPMNPKTNTPYYIPLETKDLDTLGLKPRHFYNHVRDRSHNMQPLSTLLTTAPAQTTMSNQKLITEQILTWQRHAADHVLKIIPDMEQKIPHFQTPLAKQLYFLTNYKTLLNHLDTTAVYTNRDEILAKPTTQQTYDDALKEKIFNEKRSGKYQADHSCPTYREEYQRCTDIYYTIDATTRVQIPVLHQDVCTEPFLALEQCIYQHLENWHNTMHSLYRLEHSQLYQNMIDAEANAVSLGNSGSVDTLKNENKIIMNATLAAPADVTVFNTVDVAAQQDVVEKNTMENLQQIITKDEKFAKVLKNEVNLFQKYQQHKAEFGSMTQNEMDIYALDKILQDI